jgi:hypothetical protein
VEHLTLPHVSTVKALDSVTKSSYIKTISSLFPFSLAAKLNGELGPDFSR